MKRWLSLFLCTALLLLSACSSGQSSQLVAQAKTPPAEASPVTQEGAQALTGFGLELLKNLPNREENPLVSPASVAYALGMTANGAQGQTLAQMEAVLGLPLEPLNQTLSGWKAALPAEDDCSIHLANALWLRDDPALTVQDSFLQAAARWYDAAVYKAPFDHSTVEEINGWVKKHTREMIPSILSGLPEDGALCLVNALAFDAQWKTPYRETQVRDGRFYPAEGGSVQVDMMYSTEWQYLEDERATGFIKPYAGSRCAFAALMPDVSFTVESYLETLTAEHLYELLSQPQREEVDAGLPAFTLEYDAGLADPLKAMGMTDAFSSKADFSAMGHYAGQPLYIGSVLHKTYIKVDPQGTKAAAATAVVAVPTAAPAEDTVKEVILERPFLYFLIDTQTNLPFFMGIMENPQ